MSKGKLDPDELSKLTEWKLIEWAKIVQGGGTQAAPSFNKMPYYAQFIPNSGIKPKQPQGRPMAARKFKDGDKVETLVNKDGVEAGAYGRIIDYAYSDSTYLVDFDDGNTDATWYRPSQLQALKDPVKAAVEFDSVVMPDEKREQILEALEQINQQDLIFNVWGFGETIEKGKGVSLLFYGPPGTGKTLTAQAIATKLNKTLKVISTADIESSAPGESERNIRKHFKNAKANKDILLFDECDSLIFSRSNVGPILGAQTNELLSQIERFEGITIFTTNRLGTLDEAVNRRLALKLEFEMPSREERAEIWKRMFPKQAPLDKQVDWMRLAVVEVAGGFIKNAVLRAARMAAIEEVEDEFKRITMDHLVKALRLEAESMLKFEEAHAMFQGSIAQLDAVGERSERVIRTRPGEESKSWAS